MSAAGEAQAEALRIAERWLLKQGWKFEPKDVGERASQILAALITPTPPAPRP